MFTRILDGLGLVLARSGYSSLTGKSLEAFRTYEIGKDSCRLSQVYCRRA
jgi:hypothetical protein